MATITWVDGWTGDSVAEHLGIDRLDVLLSGEDLIISGLDQAAVDAAMKSYTPPAV